MLKHEAASPNVHRIFPASINVIRADILEAKLTAFTFPVDFSKSILASFVKASNKKVPVPGP